MIKKFTKIQVDYMYSLLEYIYNNYNWICHNNFRQYQWENNYKYYKFLYVKSQYSTTDIF